MATVGFLGFGVVLYGCPSGFNCLACGLWPVLASRQSQCCDRGDGVGECCWLVGLCLDCAVLRCSFLNSGVGFGDGGGECSMA